MFGRWKWKFTAISMFEFNLSLILKVKTKAVASLENFYRSFQEAEGVIVITSHSPSIFQVLATVLTYFIVLFQLKLSEAF